MTNNLLLDIINKLIELGYATAKDVDIFMDFNPDEPGKCIIVNEYAGTGAPWYATMSVRSIQIVVRDYKSLDAMTTSWNLYNAINPTEPISNIFGSPSIISMRSTPIKIRVDSKQRVEYGFNMGITTQIN